MLTAESIGPAFKSTDAMVKHLASTVDSLLAVQQPRKRRGRTPNEVAEYLRVRPERVRTWIKNGTLGAINTSPTRVGKPRWVILPRHLKAFIKGRETCDTSPKPYKRVVKPSKPAIDFFPGD